MLIRGLEVDEGKVDRVEISYILYALLKSRKDNNRVSTNTGFIDYSRLQRFINKCIRSSNTTAEFVNKLADCISIENNNLLKYKDLQLHNDKLIKIVEKETLLVIIYVQSFFALDKENYKNKIKED